MRDRDVDFVHITGSLNWNGNGQGEISGFQYLCLSLLICVHLRQKILS